MIEKEPKGGLKVCDEAIRKYGENSRKAGGWLPGALFDLGRPRELRDTKNQRSVGS